MPRVKLEIAIKECTYWNYDNHTRTHDCGSCHCLSEGNTLRNALCGVMIGKDRYCTLDANIYGELVKKLNDNGSFKLGDVVDVECNMYTDDIERGIYLGDTKTDYEVLLPGYDTFQCLDKDSWTLRKTGDHIDLFDALVKKEL